MSKYINITIDGGSGVGKGALSSILSQKLGYTLIDSGAMYRALSYFLVRRNISITTVTLEHLKEYIFSYGLDKKLYVNGEYIEDLPIRTSQNSQNVSKYARNKFVREYVNYSIQHIMVSKGYIIDGRDAGTVIAPHSEVKFYIECPIEIKTKRRLEEYKKKGLLFTYEEVKQELEERDTLDLNCELSPLRVPKNAFIITNDDSKPLDEHGEDMMTIVRKYIM